MARETIETASRTVVCDGPVSIIVHARRTSGLGLRGWVEYHTYHRNHAVTVAETYPSELTVQEVVALLDAEVQDTIKD